MKKFLLITLTIATVTSCSLIGIHFKIHNPKRAGKYPKETEALKLLGDQTSHYRTCFDVKWYSLSVMFGMAPEKKGAISGAVALSAVATTPFDTLQLDYDEHSTIKEMSFDFIRQKELPANASPVAGIHFYRKANAVFVVMPHHIREGETFNLQLFFSGKPIEAKNPPWDGGFTRKKDDLKNPWWGVSCETEGASIWFPCKDVVNDEPDSVDMSYIVPDTLTAVGNGNLVAANEIEGHLKEYRWHVSYPINLYDVTFYIGKFRLLHDIYVSQVTHDTLQLNHYVLEQHYDKAKVEFEQQKDYLAFYEKTFGPYPWYRDGFKLVESPYEGMEHQTAIAYGNGFKNDPVYKFDYIILHESAHEWWGNGVTAEDLGDGWIHEGFATYAEVLWVEHKFGKEKALNYLLNDRMLIINRRPVSRPYNIRYFDSADEDIYNKGAWILHSLRYAIGDDSLFFGALKTFYSRYVYKNATTRDFEKVVEDVTGKDFKWFFDQYLYNRFVPELEMYLVDGKLYYRWAKTNGNFPMPVTVEMSGGKNCDVIIHPTAATQVIDLKGGNNVVTFNEFDFLVKVVEKKSLAANYQQ